MIELTVKTLDSQNHAFSVEEDVSIFICIYIYTNNFNFIYFYSRLLLPNLRKK